MESVVVGNKLLSRAIGQVWTHFKLPLLRIILGYSLAGASELVADGRKSPSGMEPWEHSGWWFVPFRCIEAEHFELCFSNMCFFKSMTHWVLNEHLLHWRLLCCFVAAAVSFSRSVLSSFFCSGCLSCCSVILLTDLLLWERTFEVYHSTSLLLTVTPWWLKEIKWIQHTCTHRVKCTNELYWKDRKRRNTLPNGSSDRSLFSFSQSRPAFLFLV